MKTEKRMAFAALVLLLTAATSCDDWGKQDPPAGNQVKPTLENVAAYDFEAEEGIDRTVFTPVANPGGSVPGIVEDDVKGKVLRLDNGYVALSNPLSKVTLQEGASFTFWMKQPVVAIAGEDGEPEEKPQDLAGPLLTFENETGNGTLSINANGGINYLAADGEWTENDPAEVATGYIRPGEWHFVAVVLSRTGYEWWVDGERKVSKTVDNFDCSKIVRFVNNVPRMTIGSPDNASPWLIDDLKIFRNKATAKETARPSLPGENQNPGGFDFSTFDYVQEAPILKVGSEDCTTAWWTAFSNYFRIPADANMRISLTNHTSGGGNWNNWNLCLCTDADRGAEGYAEYFVIRSDLFGWGDCYNGDAWTSEGYGDWDKFRADMEGAKVVIDIRRAGADVLVSATATAADGTVYVEKFTAACGEGTQIVRAFLICDGSYLEISDSGTFAFLDVPVATTTVGAADNTSAWWTTFSDYFSIDPGMSLHLGFTNHSSMGGNWNNWNLCVSSDADRGADGYAEYYVIRSDLFGWGDCYNGDAWTSEGYGDWDKFRADMNGAYVDLDIVRDGDKIISAASAKAPGGAVYKESMTGAGCGDGTQTVRAFLVCDGSHFVLSPSDCYTYRNVFRQ